MSCYPATQITDIIILYDLQDKCLVRFTQMSKHQLGSHRGWISGLSQLNLIQTFNSFTR